MIFFDSFKNFSIIYQIVLRCAYKDTWYNMLSEISTLLRFVTSGEFDQPSFIRDHSLLGNFIHG
jgi:hypothetical protein